MEKQLFLILTAVQKFNSNVMTLNLSGYTRKVYFVKLEKFVVIM